jgi:hypothetical protein
MKLFTDQELEIMWKQFKDIPITDDEEIDEDFYQWKPGTDRFEIWSFFDDFHSRGVVWLQQNVSILEK